MVGWKKGKVKSLWWGIHIHFEWLSVSFEELHLSFKNFQNLWNDSQSKEQMISRSIHLFCLATTQDWRRPKSSTSYKVIMDKQESQFIQIVIENFVINLAYLKYNWHCSDSWSTTNVLAFAQGWAKGKLGGVCWWSLSTDIYRQHKPKEENIHLYTHIPVLLTCFHEYQ
jgi:hypothetical protein